MKSRRTLKPGYSIKSVILLIIIIIFVVIIIIANITDFHFELILREPCVHSG